MLLIIGLTIDVEFLQVFFYECDYHLGANIDKISELQANRDKEIFFLLWKGDKNNQCSQT